MTKEEIEFILNYVKKKYGSILNCPFCSIRKVYAQAWAEKLINKLQPKLSK